jgi:Family of unknown function (DUF6263)
MKSIKVFLFIGSLFLLENLTGQEKFLLEYRYVKGKTYKYQEESKFESVQEINGQEMKATGSTFSLMKMIVEGVSESGDITFINSLEDLKITTKMPTMDTTMVMKDLLNKNIQTIISKTGKMIDQKILDTVNTGKNFTEKGNSLLTVYKEFVVFPDRELKFGDTWNTERNDTTKGTQMVTKVNAVYTLAAIEEKNSHPCLKITYTGKVEVGGKMTQMGMEFFMEGSGETSGTVWFDQQSGLIIAKESTNEQDLTMALTGQMQMTIPITQTVNSKFTLIE